MIGSFALPLLRVVARTEAFLHFVCFTSAKNRQGWLLLSLQVTVQSQARQFLGKPIQDIEGHPLVSLNLSTVCLQQALAVGDPAGVPAVPSHAGHQLPAGPGARCRGLWAATAWALVGSGQPWAGTQVFWANFLLLETSSFPVMC